MEINIEELVTIQNLVQVLLFMFFVILGVLTNFLFKSNTDKLGFKRKVREFVGAIWLSIIIFGVLAEFFELSYFFIFTICSLVGYGNSKIIDFINKDLFEFLFIQGKQAVKNLVGRLKHKDDDDYYPRFPRYRENKEDKNYGYSEIKDTDIENGN